MEITQTPDRVGIAYLIGGSVASSMLGKYRFTKDIDFVVDLQSESVDDFVTALHLLCWTVSILRIGQSPLMWMSYFIRRLLRQG
jgi:hypothetical protein